MLTRLETELPRRMRTMQRDARGYPIPFIVLRDKSGTPQFTINDVEATTECRVKRLCSICGKRFDRHPVTFKDMMWFVGGSRCFLHERGAFLDPPMHLVCAEYALRVCPFLAASRYLRRIDDAKLKPENTPDGMTLVREKHMQPDLPERFGLGLTYRFSYRETLPGQGVHIVSRWEHVEWWKAGEPVNAPDTGQPPPDAEVV